MYAFLGLTDPKDTEWVHLAQTPMWSSPVAPMPACSWKTVSATCPTLLTWAAALLDPHHGRAECGGRRWVSRRREGPLGDTRWAAGMGRTPIHGHLTLKNTEENNVLQNSPQCWIMGNAVNLRTLRRGTLWAGETYRTTSISAPRRHCQFTQMMSSSS